VLLLSNFGVFEHRPGPLAKPKALSQASLPTFCIRGDASLHRRRVILTRQEHRNTPAGLNRPPCVQLRACVLESALLAGSSPFNQITIKPPNLESPQGGSLVIHPSGVTGVQQASALLSQRSNNLQQGPKSTRPETSHSLTIHRFGLQGGRHHDVVARISPNRIHTHWRLDFLVAPRAEPDWFVTQALAFI
jgi:hypothetical protein